MTLASALPTPPQTIRVTGAWNEEWTLVPGNTLETYTSNLPPVRQCGETFQEYIAMNNDIGSSQLGIRCVRHDYGIWYGAGDWNGTLYAHIGINFSSGGEAVDICEPSGVSFCNVANSLNISPNLQQSQGEDYDVTGNWNEVWSPNFTRGTF